MANQLARGIFAEFGVAQNPWQGPNGMEQNLRLIDDHLGLYTLEAPVAPGTPLPASPQDGDGQIFTDGTYAIFNVGVWKTYPARKGIVASLSDGTALWVAASGQWIDLSAAAAAFAWQQAYAAGTLGYALREMRNIRNFGTFANDGVTDDSATWQAAAASDARIIDARGVTSKCLSQINVKNGQTWLLEGATLTFAGAANRLFSAVNVDDWNLVGPFKMIGDLVTNPGETVTSAGVYISNCRRFRVIEPTGVNIRGSVVESVPGAGTTGRMEHGVIVHPRGKACVWGYKDTAGTSAEYMTVMNPHFEGMAAAGLETAAGNITVLGGQLSDNFDGLRVRGGSNHAHGIILGISINHNTNFNAHFKDVSNGETVLGCHFYGNGPGFGPIVIENSKGVVISEGTLDCWVYNDSGALSGPNYLRNMYCPGGYGPVSLRSVATGVDQLRAIGNFGPGAYELTTGVSINSSGGFGLSVTAGREAGVMQVLPSGEAAALTWPSLFNSNRSLLYSGGVFEAKESGWYELKGNQVFSATAISAGYLSVQTKVGEGSWTDKDLSIVNVFNASSPAGAPHLTRFYLNGGDQVRINAVITGTGTVTHGHGSWNSWVSFERVA